MKENFFKFLEEKADFIRKQTIKFHLVLPETRIASSLSCIEIFVVLFYGKILNIFSNKENKDRFVISKGHGAISIFPILLDLGIIKKIKIENIGSIPDISLPYIDLINGSLGHGLGQGCGMALGLKKKRVNGFVFVLLGDGELYEGSIWESLMFASHHKLDNLIIIIDKNDICMLDYCKNVIDLTPLEKKLKSFDFEVKKIDGHNVKKIYEVLKEIKSYRNKKPNVLIAETIKGKGVPFLENNPLCHVMSLDKKMVNEILKNERE